MRIGDFTVANQPIRKNFTNVPFAVEKNFRQRSKCSKPMTICSTTILVPWTKVGPDGSFSPLEPRLQSQWMRIDNAEDDDLLLNQTLSQTEKTNHDNGQIKR
jgi:hypothetical protein